MDNWQTRKNFWPFNARIVIEIIVTARYTRNITAVINVAPLSIM